MKLGEHLSVAEDERGHRFTVARAYAFYALRAWQTSLKSELTKWPVLGEYTRGSSSGMRRRRRSRRKRRRSEAKRGRRDDFASSSRRCSLGLGLPV